MPNLLHIPLSFSCIFVQHRLCVVTILFIDFVFAVLFVVSAILNPLVNKAHYITFKVKTNGLSYYEKVGIGYNICKTPKNNPFLRDL